MAPVRLFPSLCARRQLSAPLFPRAVPSNACAPPAQRRD
jgi:hypothetical protein